MKNKTASYHNLIVWDIDELAEIYLSKNYHKTHNLTFGQFVKEIKMGNIKLDI